MWSRNSFEIPEAGIYAASPFREEQTIFISMTIFFLFNDITLIADFNFMNAFDVVDGIPQYDWSKIVEKDQRF